MAEYDSYKLVVTTYCGDGFSKNIKT